MSSKSASILIVEDNSDIRLLMAKFLRGEGFEVKEAENGEHGLKVLRNSASSQTLPDLVLLDLMMPIKDGFEFREEQLQDPILAKIPVVVMSADSGGLGRVAETNVAKCQLKPVDIDQLLEAIQGVIGLSGNP